MKKTKRIIAVILTLIICLSVTGCVMTPSALEEMKQCHGVWTDKGSIMLNGMEYKLLSDCDTLYPVSSGRYTVWVTDADVPTMLSTRYGEPYDITDDGMMLTSYEYMSNGEDNLLCYCREDKYDEVEAQIKNKPELNGMCYEYYDYKNEMDVVLTLTAEQVDAVNAMRAAAEPTILPYDSTVEYDYILSLYACSDNLLFRKRITDLCILEGKYFFVDFLDYETRLYEVPEAYNGVMADIMDSYIASEKVWEEMYGEYTYEYEYDYLDEE